MATALAEAHITAQQRLRALAAAGVRRAWQGLPSYDEDDVDVFLSLAVPVVVAAQRQSVALTDAFLAQSIGRPPLGVGPATILSQAVRPGVDPEQVYRRPFVTVWTALAAGTDYADAVNAGLARATSTAETDVQLAMRGTLREAGEADDLILGYQRVPDAEACSFCKLVSGQRYRTADLMPIHNRCGCGVDVITGPERPSFTGVYDNDPISGDDGETVAIREHGELGPVLVSATDRFTSAADLG